MVKKYLPVALIILISFMVLGVSKQIVEAIKISSRLDKAADSFSRLQEENRQLKKRLSEVEKDDFVESQARNKLNMSKEEETVVMIDSGVLDRQIQQNKKEQPLELQNWQKWLKLLWN